MPEVYPPEALHPIGALQLEALGIYAAQDESFDPIETNQLLSDGLNRFRLECSKTGETYNDDATVAFITRATELAEDWHTARHQSVGYPLKMPSYYKALPEEVVDKIQKLFKDGMPPLADIDVQRIFEILDI